MEFTAARVSRRLVATQPTSQPWPARSRSNSPWLASHLSIRSATARHFPASLDEPVRALAGSNYNGQTAADPKSPWVFRGNKPGTHIAPARLRTKLKPILAALEARLGTLNQLTQTTPIAILAETLSYNTQTLEPTPGRPPRPTPGTSPASLTEFGKSSLARAVIS
jgi:hypothetical protein